VNDLIFQKQENMRLLNIFSGTGSVSKPWKEAGHQVIDLDIDNSFNPVILQDILEWNYKELPWIPDVIWSSPPCTEYSIAKTVGVRNLTLADNLVARTLEIITYFESKNPNLIWFLENGQTTLLWKREVAKSLTNYVDLDYCQYGTLYRKRTRIAHSKNLIWHPKPKCNPKTCSSCVDGVHLKSAQKGNDKNKDKKFDRCTVHELHALPKKLTEEILHLCES
jgi:hypothetical protein